MALLLFLWWRVVKWGKGKGEAAHARNPPIYDARDLSSSGSALLCAHTSQGEGIESFRLYYDSRGEAFQGRSSSPILCRL